MEAAAKLLAFRQQVPGFVTPSFPTISSVGANAAIIHYHVRAGPSAPTTTSPLTRPPPPSLPALRAGGRGQVLQAAPRLHLPVRLWRPIPGGHHRRHPHHVAGRFCAARPPSPLLHTCAAGPHCHGHRACAAGAAAAASITPPLPNGQARFPEGTGGDKIDVMARAPLWRCALPPSPLPASVRPWSLSLRSLPQRWPGLPSRYRARCGRLPLRPRRPAGARTCLRPQVPAASVFTAAALRTPRACRSGPAPPRCPCSRA